MNTKTKNIIIAISVIIAYLIYGSFASIILALFNIDYNKLNITYKIIYVLLYEALFIFMLFMIYKDDMIKDFNDFKKKIGYYLKKYIKYWFLLILLMYLSNTLILIIKQIFNQGAEIAKNEEAVRDLLGKYPIYTFITAVIFAPIEEEIVFRKTLSKIFSNKYVYITISGILFGLMHVIFGIENIFDLLYIIPYGIPGAIFAYVYNESGNLFVNTSLHFIHNGVLITLQILISLI